jgi:tetratricopeptide (TPR) repeat protein
VAAAKSSTEAPAIAAQATSPESAPEGYGRCPNCGGRARSREGLGLFLTIPEWNADLLVALLAGALDRTPCEICGHALVAPTVSVISPEPATWTIFIGTQAESQSEGIVDSYRRGFTSDNPPAVNRVSTLDELRAFVTSRLKRHLAVLNAALVAHAKGALQAHIGAHWRDLVPEVFAAGAVCSRIAVKGVQLAGLAKSGGPSLSQDDARSLFAGIQSVSWFALWLAWALGEEGCTSLEADLRRYIHVDGTLPGAPEAFLERLEHFTAQHLEPSSFEARYCREAVRASVCLVAGTQNPNATTWARLFVAWELGTRRSEAEVRERASPLIISSRRARETIPFESAWDAVLPYATSKDAASSLPHLDEVINKAGHPELIRQLNDSVGFQTEDDHLEVVLELLRGAAKQRPGALADPPAEFVRPLMDKRDFEGLESIAAELIKLRGGNDEARAEAESWLGSKFKVLRQPERFLERIGDSPRDWEHELSTHNKARLWLERSNHLRLIGRHHDALVVVMSILRARDGIDAANLRVVRLNFGILLRETGSPDLAIDQLVDVLAEANGRERIDVLHSLSQTYTVLGDEERAVAALDRALEFAKGPFKGGRSKLLASRALVLAAAGQAQRARADLKELGGELEKDTVTLIPGASAWTTLALQRQVTEEDGDALGRLHELLYAEFEKAEATGDVRLQLDTIHLYAALSDAVGLEMAEDAWKLAQATERLHDVPPDPLTQLALARRAYMRHDSREARTLLAELPTALAARFGGVYDVARAVGGPTNLRGFLHDVALQVLKQGEPFADVRLICELKRDTLMRARSFRGSEPAPSDLLREGISDDLAARLAPARGRTAVLEWLDTRDHIAAFATVISAQGRVEAHWLSSPPVPLADLAETIRWRLSNWTRRRPGDPFDHEDWRQFERWLLETLGVYLETDDHLVVLDHGDHAGLPWHVAASSRWSCSYAAGWTSLLAMPPRQADSRKRLGVAVVPDAHEAPEVLAAYAGSLLRSRAFAAGGGVMLDVEDGHGCDRERFSTMLGDGCTMKVLCHGYVSPSTHEVAWMLAAENALPVKLAVGSDVPGSRPHRFGWREMQHLRAAPAVVFSAACSTGVAHLAGLGDRLGLMAGLRGAGTLSLIAPQWDIFATEVLPILDDALERFLRGGELAASVRGACLDASTDVPQWLRWSIAIEGGWR